MPLQVDWFNKLILVTSPTVSVDGQTLHDFIEDAMGSPRGLAETPDIIQPEGKIEDPSSPGEYSQIILVWNSPWQMQFWQGSGYTEVKGAKMVGGLNGEVMKATGLAGDITVLKSPVDGLAIGSGGGGLTEAQFITYMDNYTKLDEIKQYARKASDEAEQANLKL